MFTAAEKGGSLSRLRVQRIQNLRLLWCGMWRRMAVGTCLALLVGGGVSGQGQRSPATLDDLLREVRALRADLNESLRSTTRPNW